jgi:nucleotide-binding universal stress UspA family protein
MQIHQPIRTQHSETTAEHIENLLIVIDAKTLERASTGDALIRRAVWLAQGVGARIELFHVSDEESRMTRWLHSRQEQTNERIETADSAATRLAEFAVNITAATGLKVDHDARWSKDEAAAVVQKAAESRADIILKATERASYRVGLLDHPDWALIRQSPAHVWFVGDDERAPRHLLAAIGADDTRQEADESDQHVCNLASLLRQARQVRTSVLHLQTRRSAGAQNKQSVTDLIDTFPLDPVSTNLIESTPRDAIPTFAEALDADLILMGATRLTRLDRLLRPVTEEPVLARTTCDVAFLRPSTLTESPPPAEPTVQGLPAVDIERALTDPDIVFDHSPEKLVEEDRLSVEMRQRLLGVWEQDVKAALVAEDDGGTTAASPASLIPAIQRARATLESGNRRSGSTHE